MSHRGRHDPDVLRQKSWEDMTRNERISAVKYGIEKPHGPSTEYQRHWRAANPERVAAAKRRHRYRDNETFRAKDAEAKRKRRLGRGDDNTKAFLSIIAGDLCSYCLNVADQVDHIVPLSRGGENHWTNYTAACGSCNAAKKDRSLFTYLLRRLAV